MKLLLVRLLMEGKSLLANGEKLSSSQRVELNSLRDIIVSNWEKVIAESVFKYAGSVYDDLGKLETIMESNGDNQSFCNIC